MNNQEQRLINLDPELILSSRQAAEILRISPREVRSKIERGTLAAAKFGRRYLIHRGAVEVYQELRAALKRNNSAAPVRGNKADIPNTLIQRKTDYSTCCLPGINDWPPLYPNAIRELMRI